MMMNISKIISTIYIASALCILTNVVFSQDRRFERRLESEKLSDVEFQKVKNMVRKAENFRGNEQDDFYYILRVLEKDGEKVKADTKIKVNVNQGKDRDRNALVKILSGTSKGNIILQKDINMWFYKPGTARALRISSAQRLIGGASYSDVSATNYIISYDPISLEAVKIGKIDAYNITLKKIKRGVTYETINFYITQTDNRPIKGEFYTVSGRLIKTMYFRNYKTVLLGDGANQKKSLITSEWIIVDRLNEKKITTIIIESMGLERLNTSSYTAEGILQ